MVVQSATDNSIISSVTFNAGWYAPAPGSGTPDTLDVSLNQPSFQVGDQAVVRVVPRKPGLGLVSVMSNRLISKQVVELDKGENKIPLNVGADWGPGAYVTVQMVHELDKTAGHNPHRTLGLAYAKVIPGEKQLGVSVAVLGDASPRESIRAKVQVNGVEPGQTAFVTVAAVDVGVLNLTGFTAPDPSDHYFGQRRLGIDIRDVYGRLIDGLNGHRGQVRSGGGTELSRALAAGADAPPALEDLVSFFHGPLPVAADGTVELTLGSADFNGTLRLMAVAWSDTGVGQAQTDVVVAKISLVRDSNVRVTPRFI